MKSPCRKATSTVALVGGALAALSLGGCATLPVPPALAAARAARAQVLQEPRGSVSQDEFSQAEDTLRIAENESQRNPTTWQAGDSSYIAQRRMETVLVHARKAQHDAHRIRLEQGNNNGPGGQPVMVEGEGGPPGYPPQGYPNQGPGGVNIIQTPAPQSAPTIIQTQAPNPQPTVITVPSQQPPDDGRVKALSSQVEKLQSEIDQAHKDAQAREEHDRQAQAKQEKDQAAADAQRQREAEEARLQKKQAQLDEMRKQLDAERNARKMEDDLGRIGQVRQDPRGTVVTLVASKLFNNGKSQLLPGGRKLLDQLVDSLKNGPKRPIEVDGFTDSRGKQQTNERLSQRRAEVVRDYLSDQGISEERLTAKGMGPANPVADNSTVEGRAINRRMELVLGAAPVPQSAGGSPGGASPEGSSK